MTGSNELAWISEHPRSSDYVATTTELTQYHYRPRKQHKKSRKGCQNCRQRRIKCDELNPQCGQCLHRRVQCEFQARFTEQPNSSEFVDTSRASSMTRALSHLEESSVPGSELEIPLHRGDAHELLDHFIDATTPWLGSPEYQKIIQSDGLSLVSKSPYLLHAILAISASHLSLLKAGEKKYKVAAAIHYQHALITYTSQLSASINGEDVDSIVGCGFLQTMLAFENISRLLEDQRPDSAGPAAATWLRAMQGMRILQGIHVIRSYSEEIIWYPVFLELGRCEDVRCQHANEVDDSSAFTTSKSLHSLCKFPVNSSDENPYQKPLTDLCRLMRSDISHETIGRFIVFIGGLPDDFVKLFEQNDIRAMLIMAYWCALIGGIDQWWIVSSATSECRRLCGILDNVSVPQVRDLLRFPAARCGYVLRE